MKSGFGLPPQTATVLLNEYFAGNLPAPTVAPWPKVSGPIAVQTLLWRPLQIAGTVSKRVLSIFVDRTGCACVPQQLLLIPNVLLSACRLLGRPRLREDRHAAASNP